MSRRQQGITIIELVISIATLAIALTSVTLLSGGLRRSSDTLLEVRAVDVGIGGSEAGLSVANELDDSQDAKLIEVPDGANYTDNPRALIEFGSYRSHDRILSWRELYVMPPE